MRRSALIVASCRQLLRTAESSGTEVLAAQGLAAGSAARCPRILTCTAESALAAAGRRSLHRWAHSQLPGQRSVVKREMDMLLFRMSHRQFCTPPKQGWERFYPKGKGRRPNGKQGSESSKSGDKDSSLGEVLQGGSLGQSLLFAAFVTLGLGLLNLSRSDSQQEISFQVFRNQLLATGLVDRLEVSNKNLVKVYVRGSAPSMDAEGALRSGSDSSAGSGAVKVQPGQAPSGYKYFFHIGSVDSFERKMEEAQEALGITLGEEVPITYVNEVGWQQEILRFAPTLLLIGAYIYITRRTMGGGLGGAGGLGGGGGRNIFNVGKAQVGSVDKSAKKVTFKDVAGCDEAKNEVLEFVNFLKQPAKYKELGAHIPKGALLVGPPGTGKTLLAKATAGEAGVPFLSISGSDFMEMFVGVGPARVRDLFAQARAQSPSMIFIDEIDAIGRARGKGGFAGGNDERENTLNQLLVEMDGFATTQGVVVLAGTNRPDILDKALLRPGRFDRQITIDRPDLHGREQIFRVHLASLKLDQPVEFYSQRMAALTPGFAGADIANVCNEAALFAARGAKAAVTMTDFENAVDRIIGGLEKKNKVISKVERRTVALHEAGHAVVGWFLQYAEPLLKVSIVPRGTAALGFAQYLPNENMLMTTEQMLDMTCMALGGRAAEEVMIGKISTGAQNDLERVTKMAYAQVGIYGMNKKVGLLSFPQDDNRFDKPYSNETARLIDDEARGLLDAAYARTVAIVSERRDLVQALADELLSKEVVGTETLERILGKRPFVSDELRNIDKFKGGFAPTASDAAKLASADPAPQGSVPDSSMPERSAAPLAATEMDHQAESNAPPQQPSISSSSAAPHAQSAPQEHGLQGDKQQQGRRTPPGSIVAS